MSAAPAPTGRRWQRLEPDERRAQILAATRALLAERSYADVSTEEIAVAAGVRRGLLHHYFGSKRDLFLEVVRDLLARAAAPFDAQASLETNITDWLDFVEANSATWFALMGAEGVGRDPELESLVLRARDATVERIVVSLALEPVDSVALRAVLRAFGGLAEVATREWLQQHTLTKAQTVVLLSRALSALVSEVVPAVQQAAPGAG